MLWKYITILNAIKSKQYSQVELQLYVIWLHNIFENISAVFQIHYGHFHLWDILFFLSGTFFCSCLPNNCYYLNFFESEVSFWLGLEMSSVTVHRDRKAGALASIEEGSGKQFTHFTWEHNFVLLPSFLYSAVISQ